MDIRRSRLRAQFPLSGLPWSTSIAVREQVIAGNLALEPMASDLGLNYYLSMSTAPTSDEDRVFYALRCGLGLILPFIHAREWRDLTLALGGQVSRKLRRKAARHMWRALQTDDGRNAIASAAQGFARASAEFSRRYADRGGDWAHETGDLTAEQVVELRDSAQRSEAIGALVAERFPVQDPHEVLADVGQAEGSPLAFDPDNPHARFDLHAYASRARVVGEALALAAGERYDEFAGPIRAPLIHVILPNALVRQSDWNMQSKYWANLLSPEPKTLTASLTRAQEPS